MKLLLIYPSNNVAYPLQLAAIAAYLKREGHEVRLVMPLLTSHKVGEDTLAEITNEMDSFEPDYVGACGYETALPWLDPIFSFIKENWTSRVKTIMGGYFPTLVPVEALSRPWVDIIIQNEGEYPMSRLMGTEGADLKRIPGLWWKNDRNEIISNPPGPVVPDLDELPFPDREILDFQSHLNHEPIGSRCVKIMASRGCVYLCTYCANDFLKKNIPDKNSWKTFYRSRSPENVVAEMKSLSARYQFEEFGFHDDIFWKDINWLRKFVELYEPIQKPFYCAIRVEQLSDEALDLLKAAGCKTVLMGIESGDSDFRRSMLKRKMTDESTISAFRRTRARGIKTWSFNMVGMPGESLGMMLQTVLFNWKCRPDCAQTSIFYPLRGTEMGDLCYREGLVDLSKREQVISYSWDSILKHSRWKLWFIRGMKYLNILTAARSKLFWELVWHRIYGRVWGRVKRVEITPGEISSGMVKKEAQIAKEPQMSLAESD